MEPIASFQIDHRILKAGLYVSRTDFVQGFPLTSFDLRLCAPNVEPVMDTAPIHTIEHLAATYLRNHTRKDEIIYFGPMGCRTGFYLIMAGALSSAEVLPLVKETFQFICDFEGDIPGASPKECGNCLDQSLPMAKYEARRYLAQLNSPGLCLVYPLSSAEMGERGRKSGLQ